MTSLLTKPLRHTRRVFAALSAALLVLLTMAGPASAHSVDEAVIYLDVTDRAMAGRVELPVVALREFFDLELAGSGDELLDELEPNLEVLQNYADEHLSISVDGQELDVDFDSLGLLSEKDNGQEVNFVQLGFDVIGYNGSRTFDVTFDPFFDDLDGRSGVLLIENDLGAGVYDNEETVLVTYNPENRTRTIDLDDTSSWATFSASVGLGVDHIKTGPDHVLFVLVLLLPSVLLFSGKWLPQASFGKALWRVLKIATMFTVAHSVTFTLAGLGWLPLPPSKLVEAIIAISIALAAIHNIKPIFPNKESWLAFGFGLFHGMGFASLVEGLDVSRSTQLISLLGRNVGIEIGQAAVILAGFTALFMLRRTRYYLGFLNAASIVMAIVAIGWMIERLAEIELGINDVVEPALALPRAAWIVLAATVAAIGIFFVEQKADRLIPIEPDTEDEVERELVNA